ncbi:hypothetical protein MNBD_ALPHA06-2223 [hydrothermal vent metagenome]|uniref:Type II secretion system protein GspC N-terminal domain-containing protein n=1 Tax=hydrothermal vent metagenome TaxID=652676 RepID=A0A3B0RF32_9ZZZZ
MNRRMLLLLAVAVVLGGALIFDRLRQTEDLSLPRQNQTTAEKPATAPRSLAKTSDGKLLPPISGFTQIWQRTLFRESRKAPVFATQSRTTTNDISATTTSDEPPDFTIVGTAIRPSGGSVMIRKKNREIVRALVGDEVDGWSIDSISVDSVILSRNGKSWDLPVGAE